MKRLLFSYIVLFFIILGCEKPCFNSKSKGLFEKTYSTEMVNGAVCLTNDNGYFIAGTYYQDFTTFLIVTKIKSTGQQEWAKKINADIDTDGKISTIQTGNNYFILGHKKYGPVANDISQIWLAKVDNIGNLLWQKTLDSTYYGFGKNIIKNSDNDFSIFCDIVDKSIKYEMIRIDSDGNVFDKKYYSLTEKDDYLSVLINATNNLDSLTKSVYKTLVNEYSSGAVIVKNGYITHKYGNTITKVNPMGEVEWVKTLRSDCSISRVNYKENDIYIFGNIFAKCGETNTDCDIYVAKINASGELTAEYNVGEGTSNCIFDVIKETISFTIVANDSRKLYIIKI